MQPVASNYIFHTGFLFLITLTLSFGPCNLMLTDIHETYILHLFIWADATEKFACTNNIFLAEQMTGRVCKLQRYQAEVRRMVYLGVLQNMVGFNTLWNHCNILFYVIPK